MMVGGRGVICDTSRSFVKVRAAANPTKVIKIETRRTTLLLEVLEIGA